MKDWNVVVSIYQTGFRRALRALGKLGPVARSPYHNVLVMKVDDVMVLLQAVEQKTEEDPALYDAISRVAPAERLFEFQSARDFEDKAKAVMLEWLPRLTGRSFHVRLHRRGASYELHSPDVERLLNDTIIEATTQAGAPAKISFTDPDVVIPIDTIDDRAGLSLWTREQLAHHRLLRPD
jgi:tRNA(Ser,Leu) C12 N-acetylase TAN1